jgi:hypothetical protein
VAGVVSVEGLDMLTLLRDAEGATRRAGLGAAGANEQ